MVRWFDCCLVRWVTSHRSLPLQRGTNDKFNNRAIILVFLCVFCDHMAEALKSILLPLAPLTFAADTSVTNAKLMKKTNIIVLLIITLHFAGCGQDVEDQTIPDWKSLAEDNYSLRYPEAWTLDQSQQMGTKFILFSPLSSAEDQFKENVNLILQDLEAYDLNLDQYVELSEDQVKTLIAEGNILFSERVKQGDLEFHKLIYTGKQGDFDLKFEQYFWLEDKKAYVLTFTAEKEQFEAYRATAEKILNSFQIE